MAALASQLHSVGGGGPGAGHTHNLALQAALHGLSPQQLTAIMRGTPGTLTGPCLDLATGGGAGFGAWGGGGGLWGRAWDGVC